MSKKFVLGLAAGVPVGFVLVASYVVKLAMQNESVRAGVKDGISNTVEILLFGEQRPRRRFNGAYPIYSDPPVKSN